MTQPHSCKQEREISMLAILWHLGLSLPALTFWISGVSKVMILQRVESGLGQGS